MLHLAFVALLVAVALSSTRAQPPDDPCDIVGVYELDRDAVHAQVVADMDHALRDLDDEPEAGTLAHIVWEAQLDAFRGVRQQAAEGRMVPPIATRLDADGTARQVEHDLGEAPDWSDAETGRWTADATCETVEIDVGDHETTAAIEDGHLVLHSSHGDDRDHFPIRLLRVE